MMVTADKNAEQSTLVPVLCIVLAGVLLRVSLGTLGSFLWLPVIPLCLVGLVASAAISSPSAARAGFKFLLGRASDGEYPSASRALAAGGNFLIHLGAASSFIALFSSLDTIRLVWDSLQHDTPYPNIGPADLARTFHYGILIAVPASLLSGRFILGAAAEAAASRASLPRPIYSFTVQFAALLVLPAQFAMIVIPFPSITH